MRFLTTALLFLTFSLKLYAYDAITYGNKLTPFTEMSKNQIISQVRVAKDYFMTSTDAAAGKTFEERTANLNKAISKTFEAFINKRTNEYRNVTAHYHATDANHAGGSSWKTITCEQGFYFIQSTLVRTQNGDWKGGPQWTETTLRWKTGGHRHNQTFVDVDAKYKESFIAKAVTDELNIARKELNDMGIPTELPPLK